MCSTGYPDSLVRGVSGGMTRGGRLGGRGVSLRPLGKRLNLHQYRGNRRRSRRGARDRQLVEVIPPPRGGSAGPGWSNPTSFNIKLLCVSFGV